MTLAPAMADEDCQWQYNPEGNKCIRSAQPEVLILPEQPIENEEIDRMWWELQRTRIAEYQESNPLT